MHHQIHPNMKNRLLKIALATIAFFQSASYLIAQDYSGRHYSDDSSSSSGFGFIIFVLLVVAGFIIYGVIQSNSNKPKRNNSYSSNSGYTPPTRERMQQQQADYWQSQIDYLKQKDKEGDAALKGCIWTIIIGVGFLIIFFLNNPHLFKW